MGGRGSGCEDLGVVRKWSRSLVMGVESRRWGSGVKGFMTGRSQG